MNRGTTLETPKSQHQLSQESSQKQQQQPQLLLLRLLLLQFSCGHVTAVDCTFLNSIKLNLSRHPHLLHVVLLITLSSGWWWL